MIGRVAACALFVVALTLALPAHAQFANKTGNIAGTVGGACASSANDYAWPDANGDILKCVANVWTLVTLPATAAGSTGYVQFDNGGVLAGSANLFWDNTNFRLGIGTNSPQSALQIGSGQLTVPAGSASAPSAAVGIGNTGLYSVSTTGLGFSINGLSRFDFGITNGGSWTFNTGLTATSYSATNAAGGYSVNADTFLNRAAAATWHLGNSDAASPIAQTLDVQNVAAGTTNTAGAKFTINGSQGTGIGTGGSIVFQTAPVGTSGSAQNALVPVMTILGSGNVGIGTTTPVVALDVSGVAALGSTGTAGSVSFRRSSDGVTEGFVGFLNGNTSTLNFTDQAGGSNFTWFTNNGSNTSERMRMDQNGNLGIGTTTMASKFEINGNASIGYVDTAAPSNGLIVNGNVGIGTTAMANTLEVNGAVSIGYPDIAAPSNGAIILGNVAIGSTAPVVGGTTYGLYVQSGVYFNNNITANNGQIQIGAGNSFVWNTRSRIESPANSIIEFQNQASTDFTRLDFGGTTSAFPAINSINTSTGTQTALQIIAADGSSNANLLVSGNVGIGTTNPTSLLTVGAGVMTVDSSGNLAAASTGSFSGGRVLLGSGGIHSLQPNGFLIAYSGSNSLTTPDLVPNQADTTTGFASGATGNITAVIGSTEMMRWTSTGVGIGTSNPLGYTLDVNGTLNVAGAITCGSGCSSGPWSVSGSSIIPASNSYNVGIGTTSPGATLDVQSGTITTSLPALNIAQTWNNAATNFDAPIFENITNSASGTNALLVDLQSNGSSKFNVDKNGNILVTDVKLNDAGAVGAPTIRYSGNNGIYFPGTGSMGFVTAGAEAMRINSSGNVGIGTTSPQAALDVTGQVLTGVGSVTNPSYSFEGNTNYGMYLSGTTIAFATGGVIRFNLGAALNAANSSGPGISNATGASTTAPVIYPDRSDTTTGFAAGTQGNINAIVGGTEMMRWTSTGVGIGSSSPVASLDLSRKTDALALPVGTQGQEPVSAVAGMMRYDSTISDVEYYNGSAWIPFKASGPPPGAGNFVITETVYTGNLGGLSGANADCLTDLTTHTGWWGYTQANAAGRLTSSKVFAFLCDGTNCNNLNASTTYYFANPADVTAGGGSFTTDASGLGPNDSISWSIANHFATTASAYTGRAAGASNTAWPDTNGSNNCSAWTTNSAGTSGDIGSPANTTASRWNNSSPALCSSSRPLLCFVNP